MLFPRSLRGELAQYVDRQRGQGQLISLNHACTAPTRPGGCASWSHSTRVPRASRSGSTHIFRHQLITHLTKHGIISPKLTATQRSCR